MTHVKSNVVPMVQNGTGCEANITVVDCWPIAASMENTASARDASILMSILVMTIIGSEMYLHGIHPMDAIILGSVLSGFLLSVVVGGGFQRWFSLSVYSLLVPIALYVAWNSGYESSDFMVGSDLWVLPIIALASYFVPFIRFMMIVLCFFGTLMAILAFNGREISTHTAALNFYVAPIVLSHFWLFAFRAKSFKETQLSKRGGSLSFGPLRQVLRGHPLLLLRVMAGIFVFVGGTFISVRYNLPGEAWVIVAGIGTFIAVSGARKTISVSRASDFREPNSTVLFRSFASDKVKVPNGLGLFPMSALLGFYEKETIESSIMRVFGRDGFAVLGEPTGEFDPFGAERIISDGTDWRYDVINLISETDYLLVSVAANAGTKWEICEIFRRSAEHKTIFFRCDFSDFSFEDIEGCFTNIRPQLRSEFRRRFNALSVNEGAFAFTVLDGIPKIYTSEFANSEDFEVLFMSILWGQGGHGIWA